jgi:hypothetical protein
MPKEKENGRRKKKGEGRPILVLAMSDKSRMREGKEERRAQPGINPWHN